MHDENCKCECCRSYVNIPWAVLTIRVICPTCSTIVDITERVHARVQWVPAVYCGKCGFIGIYEVHVGKIGVTK